MDCPEYYATEPTEEDLEGVDLNLGSDDVQKILTAFERMTEMLKCEKFHNVEMPNYRSLMETGDYMYVDWTEEQKKHWRDNVLQDAIDRYEECLWEYFVWK